MSLFETFLQLNSFPIKKACIDFNWIQGLSKNEIFDWQKKKIWENAKYHYQHNEFYRKKVGAKFPDCWEDIPVLTKADFQAPIKELISDEFKIKDLYIANTSGSSGHPFFYAKDKYAHAFTWALIKHRFSLHGLALNSKQARFYGIPLDSLGFLKETLKDRILNRVRFPVFDLSDKVLYKYYQKFKKHKFDYVYGYTNSLVLFARFLLKKKLDIKKRCPTLKVCIPTAELCAEEDRILLKSAFQVPVANEYGASETGIIAFEFPTGEWLLSEENTFVEIVDHDHKPLANGKVGEIIVTSFFNKAMPIIRYQIGDLGAIEGPDMQKTFHRKLKGLSGRTNDTIVLPSGKISPGLTFYYVSRSILESSGVLKEFIIKQEKINKFTFEVVTERDLTIQEQDEIKNKMDIYLEPGLDLEIKRVAKIDRPLSGKIKHFYSLLGNA